MGTITVSDGTVRFESAGITYYAKENFSPSIQVFEAEVPKKKRKGIPETFFSYGPVEKLVSLLGLDRANVVMVRLSSEMSLTDKDREHLLAAVGPSYYFSRDAQSYGRENLPHDDPETAAGFQVVLDTIVRNWDDGERNRTTVDGIPVWFDYGASLDPRYQNIYRFILKLEESRQAGRSSTIVEYFMDYSRRRSQILKKGVDVFSEISRTELRTIVSVSQVIMPAYFGEYVDGNIKRIDEDIDILRGAFLRENVLRR